ncbi:glycosyl hydrolase family 28-related protein [Streptomyces sp. NPDC001492]
MKLLVTGEQPADNINVTGGQQSAVIEVNAGAVFTVNGQSGAVNLTGVTGHLNATVAPYSADNTGVADATAAIQTAINACQPGGVVYLPRGIYKTTATLDLKNGVSLLGDHASMMVGPGMTGSEYPCYIQPAAGFTGSSVIQIIGDADGTHPNISGEQRITDLMIDGSKLTGSVDGLYARGNVQNVVLENVTIRQMTNNGIVTASRSDGTFPFSWRLRHLMIDQCHANGLLFTGNTDITLDDVQVIGCWAQGFVLTNCTNGQLTGCRAEWNGSHGYHITGAWGDWAGSGGMQMTGCSTDRNGQHGVLVDATGNTPIVLSGLMLRRDGRNGGTGGGNFAGLAVIGATVPVTIGGITCYPGVDDGAGGSPSPDYGARVTGATSLQIHGAYLHGYLGGLNDDGSSASFFLSPGSTLASGPTTAPARTVKSWPVDWLNAKTYGAKGNGTTDDTAALQALVTAAAAAKTTAYLPPGTYIVSAPVTLPAGEGYSIVGSGWGTSVKLKAASNSYILQMTGADTRVTIRDLTIDGNCLEQGTTGTSGGIYGAGAVACRIDNVHFIACRDDALYLGGMTGGAFGHNNRVIGCLFDQSMTSSGPGRGIQMLSNDENQILGCDFEFLGGSGGTGYSTAVAILDRAGTQFITACNFVGGATNNTKGVRIQDAASTKITGCNFDGTAGDSIFIAGEQNSIVGCTIFSPGEVGTAGAASGIHLEYAAARNLIQGNAIVSSSTNGRTRSLIREEAMGPAGNNQITGNMLRVKGTLGTALVELAAPGTVYTNNLGGADLGGGTGAILGITNAAVVPTTNPAGGGVLYAQAGALKWRGSSGTVTTIANA